MYGQHPSDEDLAAAYRDYEASKAPEEKEEEKLWEAAQLADWRRQEEQEA